MDANPVLKPKLATPALILGSGAVSICATYVFGTLAANSSPPWFLSMAAIASLVAGAVVGALWVARIRRLRAWAEAANDKWDHFDSVKRMHGTTTEVTVLSVDSLEPTGTWITIRWNRFDHVQRAWLEALHEPIWPGSVLLIAPDPDQIIRTAPWPASYYIQASAFLAWAPLAARSPSAQYSALDLLR